MTPPTMTWMRLARRLRNDGNPLRRRTDVIEAWLLPAAVVACLALSPLVAAAAGMWVGADNASARHAQLSWHHVPAVLLQPAAGPVMSDDGANTWLVWTPARWTADRRQWFGDVPAPADSSAGSTVTVWLDRAGTVQLPPLTAGHARSRVIVAAAVAAGSIALLLAGMVLLARRFLDKRRLAGWETAWLSVGPAWSRQQ
jgi:hypothetical protein